MIYIDSKAAALESIYLGISSSTSLSSSSIVVNPTNSYLHGKTVLITLDNYNKDIIAKLYKNNRIISRFPIENCHEVIPYSESCDKFIKFNYSNYLVLNNETLEEVEIFHDEEIDKYYLSSYLGVMDSKVRGVNTLIGFLNNQLNYHKQCISKKYLSLQ